jgi:hypothetical protein
VIALAEVHTLLAGAAGAAGDVAGRWDVIAAAFLGGYAREFWKRRGDAARLHALALDAARSALAAHAADGHGATPAQPQEA